EDMIMSDIAIAENFEIRHLEMPRDAYSYVLSNNFGRNEINDVFMFYDKAFNDPTWQSAYIQPYKGAHAGELYEIVSPGSGGPGGIDDEQSYYQSPISSVYANASNTGINRSDTDIPVMLGFIVLAAAGLVIVLLKRRSA
ncbi:MAG: hypothetical protein Q4E60_11440, partial [Bacteroidales bacterium]|nr:hypothetical protein [Bacteroidales bacterium]